MKELPPTLPYGEFPGPECKDLLKTAHGRKEKSSHVKTLRFTGSEKVKGQIEAKRTAEAMDVIQKALEEGRSDEYIAKALKKLGLHDVERGLADDGEKAPAMAGTIEYLRKEIEEIAAKVLSGHMKEIAKEAQFYQFLRMRNGKTQTESLRSDLIHEIANAEAVKNSLHRYLDLFEADMEAVILAMVQNLCADLNINESEQDLVEKAVRKAYKKLIKDQKVVNG